MKITSTAFEDGKEIPTQYTCEGQDISPALAWSDIPDATQSLVLIVEDPDAPDPNAPKVLWIHWVLYNISPKAQGLSENLKDGLPEGTLKGLTNWEKTPYGGPCPPIGRHRYFHRLYALDVVLPDLKIPTAEKLREAMVGHVLDEAILIGTYQKKK